MKLKSLKKILWLFVLIAAILVLVALFRFVEYLNEPEVSESQYVNVSHIYARSGPDFRKFIDWMYIDQKIKESEYILILKKSNVIYQGNDERA